MVVHFFHCTAHESKTNRLGYKRHVLCFQCLDVKMAFTDQIRNGAIQMASPEQLFPERVQAILLSAYPIFWGSSMLAEE